MAEDQKPQTPAAKSAAPKPAAVERAITPLLPKYFTHAKAAYQTFNALVSPGTTKEDLVDHRLYSHVANKMKLHDEIRVMELNGAFRAVLIVTFKHSNSVRLQLVDFTALEAVDYEKAAGLDRYKVENRGAIGWCVIDAETAQIVYSNQENQAAAFAKLDAHLKSLGR